MNEWCDHCVALKFYELECVYCCRRWCNRSFASAIHVCHIAEYVYKFIDSISFRFFFSASTASDFLKTNVIQLCALWRMLFDIRSKFVGCIRVRLCIWFFFFCFACRRLTMSVCTVQMLVLAIYAIFLSFNPCNFLISLSYIT